ncbi:MAG TPA: GDP-mannose 4,6-dehydratase [Acidimicrobiales bacterium]|nr:GDP-mannose 4,6-dehydratase [Acidimicrobiales bacterium]
MRALVTGGAGFIGSTLVDRLLAEEHEVDVVDDLSTGGLHNLADARANPDRKLTFHNLDIRDPGLVDVMARRQPEVVFHLAAQASVPVSVTDPIRDAEINVIGSVNILEGARRAGTRKVVYAASGGTLYGEPEELPVKESAPHRPLSPYGVSKMIVNNYLVAYRELYDLEFTALALANVYGPRQDPHGESGIIAIFSERLFAGEPCVINGDGRHTRDYVFVDDVVDAFARAADKGSGLVLNVGTGNETSNIDVYRALAAAAGVDAEPVYGPPRPGDVLRSAIDPGRAEIHLGWKPWTSLTDGAAAIFRWLNERDPRPAGESPQT